VIFRLFQNPALKKSLLHTLSVYFTIKTAILQGQYAGLREFAPPDPLNLGRPGHHPFLKRPKPQYLPLLPGRQGETRLPRLDAGGQGGEVQKPEIRAMAFAVKKKTGIEG
jgi:hypothetical protein